MQQAPIRKNNFLAVSIAAVLGLGASGSAFAVNGFQVIGYGEDQVALGGAVTANPTSAMTALSNPAGLTMVGQRADFSMEAFMPDVKVDASDTPFTGGGMLGAGEIRKSKGSLYGIPSIGWVAETSNPNISFGGGMYATAGLGTEFGTVRLNSASASTGGLVQDTTLNGFSNVNLFRISPAAGYKVAPNFSIGAALNIYMLQLGFRETLSNTPPNPGTLPPTPAGAADTNFNLGRAGLSYGVGGTIGMMFDAIPDLVRFGASYTTKANLQKTKFQLDAGDINNPAGIVGGDIGSAPAGEYAAAFDFPQQAAVGLALMPNGPFTLSADVKWINYEDTLKDFFVTGQGRTYNLNPGWEDVWVYAVGASFKSGPMRLSAGYNYSDSPVQENFTFANVLFPAIVKHHITLGANYQLGKNWELGGAFQYVPEEKITGRNDMPESMRPTAGPNSNITLSNQITSVGVNLGYRF